MRQAPDWMKLKNGELYVDKDGTLFVADLEKFLNEQGVAPPDIFDKVQENAHTIIFGEEQESSAPPSGATVGTSGAPTAAPSLVPTVEDPAGTISLHSSPSSLDASSQDSTEYDTADFTSANDDLIITQPGPDVRTGTDSKCDSDRNIAQEGEYSRQEPETPSVIEPVMQGEDYPSDADSAYESEEEDEYSVSADEVNHFTSRHERKTKDVESLDKISGSKIHDKDEL